VYFVTVILFNIIPFNNINSAFQPHALSVRLRFSGHLFLFYTVAIITVSQNTYFD